jgi:hypothetical protein
MFFSCKEQTMNRKAKKAGCLFETLEMRSLLSTVSITDYGAVADDGRDDAPAIREAMNHTQGGDTIYFPAGTFDINTAIKLSGDRTYTGERDQTLLKGTTTRRHIFYVRQDAISIRNLTFNGKPILIDKPNGDMVQDLLIDNCTFHVHARGDNYNGITFNTGLRDSRISNNTFDPIAGDNGIYGYYWDNLTIANNAFLDGNEGIHLLDLRNSSKDLLIEQNYFSGLHRMGVEYQGGGYNTVVQDNYYENPSLSRKKELNGATFAYSVIADQSSGTIVRRNTSIAPQRPDGIGVRIIFEVGGDNTLVEQNYSVAGNHVLAANDGVGSTSVLARNNRWSDYRQDASGRGLTLQNNGPDVELNWDINRGKPGPNKRLGLFGYVTPGSTADTMYLNASSAPSGTGLVYLNNLAWKSATNSWGPVELNQSVGGLNANDGQRLQLDGDRYSYGLGVAGNSQIVYRLNGKYSKFFSDIGLDDSAGNEGSVIFKIYADGKKIYDSGILNGSDSRKRISLKLAGVKELKLITNDAGDGGLSDQADWAAARLTPIK